MQINLVNESEIGPQLSYIDQWPAVQQLINQTINQLITDFLGSNKQQ